MAPRGIRNHNPGNIEAGDPWVGAVGSDGRFAIFDRPEHSIRALAKILLGYRSRHGLRTIREYINRWAPPVENDTAAYIAAVCAWCAAGPDDDYPLTAESLAPLVTAIIRHENGQQPYSPETIAAGIALALGLQPELQQLQPIATAPDEVAIPRQLPTSADRKEQPVPEFLNTVAGLVTAANPVAGLVLGIGNALIDAFSPLAKEKIAREVNRHSDDKTIGPAVATAAVDVLKQVTKIDDPVQAFLAAKANPSVMQVVETGTLDRIAQLGPLIDKVAQYDREMLAAGIAGRDAAAKRQVMDKSGAVRMLVKSTLLMVAATAALGLVAILAQIILLDDHKPSTELVVLVSPLLTIIYTNYKEMVAYFFDGTPTSNATAIARDAIAQLPQQR